MPETLLLAVIEDDDAVRDAMGELLDVLGHGSRLYSSAEQFLTNLRSEAFDCIITDLRLPGLDGLDLHRELRARGDATPVILMTSHISRQLKLRAVQAGLHAVLLKPVAAASLMAELATALDPASARGGTSST